MRSPLITALALTIALAILPSSSAAFTPNLLFETFVTAASPLLTWSDGWTQGFSNSPDRYYADGALGAGVAQNTAQTPGAKVSWEYAGTTVAFHGPPQPNGSETLNPFTLEFDGAAQPVEAPGAVDGMDVVYGKSPDVPHGVHSASLTFTPPTDRPVSGVITGALTYTGIVSEA